MQASKEITATRDVPKRAEEVKKTSEGSPLTSLITELCKDKSDFIKYKPTDLSAILQDDFSILNSFASNLEWHCNDAKSFANFNENLEKLLIFLIRNVNLDNEREARAHLVWLRAIIFPYMKMFPNLSEHLLWIGHDIVKKQFNVYCNLNTFVRELLEQNPKTPLPFTCTQSAILGNKVTVEQSIETELQKRVKPWQNPVNLQTSRLKAKAEAFKSILHKLGDAKKINDEERKTIPIASKSSSAHPLAHLTDLWLDLTTRLRDKPNEKSTFEAFAIFFEIYCSLDIDPILAIDSALAGIAICADSSLLKRRAKLLASFLEMPFESYKPEIYVKEFCKRQYQVLDRLPQDLSDFHQFLQANPNHQDLFNMAMPIAKYGISTPSLQTFSLLHTFHEVTEPITPPIEYIPFIYDGR